MHHPLRAPQALLALLTLVPTVAAQTQTTLRSLSPIGVFVQADTVTPRLASQPANTSVTVANAQGVRVEQGSGPAIHARSKASLRLLEQLPAVRIHEAGYAAKLVSPMKSRRVGTTSSTTTANLKPAAHSWLLQLKERPGRRLRLQVRFRSTAQGVGIQGAGRVDIGNDGKVEFNQALDGRRHLRDFPVRVGTGGTVLVKIETEALLSSTAVAASSYVAVLDVSFEPIGDAAATFPTYGTSCGPRLTPTTWVQNGQRFARAALDRAPSGTPALLAIGIQQLNVPIPNSSCRILTDIWLPIPFKTDAFGKATHGFQIPSEVGVVAANAQYAVLDRNGTLLTSQAAQFRATPPSGEPFDYVSLNHVLSTGQSLSVGWGATRTLSTKQPFQNKMFDTGVCGSIGTNMRLVSLVEQSVETHHSGFANLITQVAETEVFVGRTKPRHTHELLVSCHGVGGYAYSRLRKGTVPYAKGMDQVKAALAIARNLSRSYVVRAVTVVHGESDHLGQNQNYYQHLAEWQRDYQQDVRALTGQVQPIPMLHSQFSTWTRYSTPTSSVVLQQLQASVLAPRRIVMVGPKYMLQYHRDGVHLTNVGYRHMGEYYAKAYRHVVLEGGTWEPLRPLLAKRSGNVIRVRHHVPVPPLVLDTRLVSDPGNFGFEFWDDSGSVPAISSVALEDEDTVRITLNATPSGKNQFVRYAFTGKRGSNGGPTTGPRGNLRDSDNSASRHGNPLFNWAVHSETRVQ